jgi:hypothetical protein
MPKIRWLGLPPPLRQHLFDRARERKITMEDLFALDLGSFKLFGKGQYPKTFLLKGQPANGEEVE